jgi:hypothetical protein
MSIWAVLLVPFIMIVAFLTSIRTSIFYSLFLQAKSQTIVYFPARTALSLTLSFSFDHDYLHNGVKLFSLLLLSLPLPFCTFSSFMICVSGLLLVPKFLRMY